MGETSEMTGPPVYRLADGEEVLGVPYHVDRRRDLSNAKKYLLAASTENGCKGEDRRKTKGMAFSAIQVAQTQSKRHQAVVWDDETQTYNWLQPDEDLADAPEARSQPMTEQTCEVDKSHGTTSQSCQLQTEQVKTTQDSELPDDGGGITNSSGGGWTGLKLKLSDGKKATATPTATMAATAAAKVSQVRQQQLARQQHRLAKLRAAAKVVQTEAEAIARVQTMMAAVKSGSVQKLQRLGLRRTLQDGSNDLEPEPAEPAPSQTTVATVYPHEESTAHCADQTECKTEEETEAKANAQNSMRVQVHRVFSVVPPAGLSKQDQDRWCNNGRPALSADEIEALLTVKNSAGQTALSLASQRGQQHVYHHLEGVLCDHLGRAIPAAFGAGGGGLTRIEPVIAMIKMLPAKRVRRSGFYDDWMALEE